MFKTKIQFKNNFFKYLKFIVISIFVFNFSSLSYSQDNISRDKKNLDNIIKRVLDVDRKNRSYQADIFIYSKGFYEKGKKTAQEQETRMSGFLTFKKPSSVLFKVNESQDSMARGATLLYTGGKKVQVRASGLLGLVKVSFNIDDPMFSNARNHTFSFDGLKNLRSGIINSELIGKRIRNGKEAYVIKVDPIIKADPEITHEMYFVDTETFRVLAIEMYVNKDMVSQYSVKNMKANILKSDDVFKL